MMRGDQIYLRALEPEDVEVLYRWENNPANWRVSNTTAPFSKHTLERYVASTDDIYAARQLRLMICTTNHQPVGTIDLFDFDPLHRRAGVGVLVAEAARNNGYAKEALTLLIDHAWEGLQLHQLYCNILSSNEASMRLFQGLGFEVTGTKKQWHSIPEGWEDEHFLQLMQ